MYRCNKNVSMVTHSCNPSDKGLGGMDSSFESYKAWATYQDLVLKQIQKGCVCVRARVRVHMHTYKVQ